VEKLSWRLLPYAVADGPTNMATDEALLKAATGGVACLRFYGWSQPTLSLGYFQKESIRRGDPLWEALPFVRRPTGGETLVHHHELTYALILPAGFGLPHGAWPGRMHQIIAQALAAFGITARLVKTTAASQGPLCFHHFTAGDLLIGASKVAGSAQRRRHGALLQHGGILLARSPHAPSLPGICELTGHDLTPQALQQAVVQSFQVAFHLGDKTAQQPAIRQLETKYRRAAWNSRR
jgi:lipoate-protein ligase A